MYIPRTFQEMDQGYIRDFIRRNSFAALISSDEFRPVASHVPLDLREGADGELLLAGHVSKANPQWKTFKDDREVLALFSGPHSYVSAAWYTVDSAPTWNYISIHVYGLPRILTDKAELHELLKRLVDGQEGRSPAGERYRMESLPKDILEDMMNGIVGFEIAVTRIEAAAKLSQNRNDRDYGTIIEKLRDRGDPGSLGVAREMALRRPESGTTPELREQEDRKRAESEARLLAMKNHPQAQGYLALPKKGKGPGVVVLHAWWGLNGTIKAICDRLADSGFVAFAPDLYHGRVTDSIAEAERLGSSLDAKHAQATAEIMEAANFLAQHPSHAGGSLAVLGFSLGAYYALDLAAADPGHIAAVVLFYGTGGGDFSGSKAAYLGHFAELDQFEPASHVDELEESLRRAGRPVTFHRYAGTSHWFFEPDRSDAYDKAAAAVAWERTLAFLKKSLTVEPK